MKKDGTHRILFTLKLFQPNTQKLFFYLNKLLIYTNINLYKQFFLSKKIFLISNQGK